MKTWDLPKGILAPAFETYDPASFQHYVESLKEQKALGKDKPASLRRPKAEKLTHEKSVVAGFDFAFDGTPTTATIDICKFCGKKPRNPAAECPARKISKKDLTAVQP